MSADPGVRPSGATCLAIVPSTNETVAVYALDVRSGRRRKDHAVATALHAWYANTVSHPAIVRPLDAGVEAGTPYVVYPLLRGITLEELLQRDGAQSLETAVQWLTPVADAIDRAASAGIHHGALSPAHIVVDDGMVSVTAFGLVQALTQAGVTVPLESPYASPGRLAGAPPSSADDVYALAAIALTILAGEPPSLQSNRGGPNADRAARSMPPLTPAEEEALRSVVGVDAGVLRQEMARGLSRIRTSGRRVRQRSYRVCGVRSYATSRPCSDTARNARVRACEFLETGDRPPCTLQLVFSTAVSAASCSQSWRS